MKYVSTAELKAKLSHYLGEVKEGSSVYVTSHGRPVAEVRAIGDGLGIRAPERPVSDLARIRRVVAPASRGEELLLEDRGSR